MLSEQKLLALRSFLGVLPGQSALRLARMVEIDRLSDGNLPHEIILDYLRPALRQHDEHDRVPSPIRSFCLPFEDLLFSTPRLVKRRGCIARAVIQPTWHWLERRLMPQALREFVTAFKASAANEDRLGCEALTADFWRLAGQTLADALDGAESAQAPFADAGLVADAREIATLLMGGSIVQDVKTLFPKHSPVPGDEKMQAFKAIHNRALDTMPDLVPYLPVVVMGRLEKPWQVMRLVSYVSLKRKDTVISATDIGLAGEILFGRMEDALSVIQGMQPQNFEPDRMIDNLTEFTLLSGAITKEVDILRDGAWGKRLLSNRSTISAIMEGYMERASREIAAAIPLKSSSVGARTLVPHLAKMVDDKVVAQACRYAKLLSGCRYLAAPASFIVKYEEASNSTIDMLCFYNDAMLNELREPEWADRAQVERQFSVAMELSRLLLGADEASLLHRRGTIAREAARG